MLWIILNSIGIVCSIIGCTISVFQWINITPEKIKNKRKYFIIYFLPIVLFILLIFLSFNLYININIKTQSGTFEMLSWGNRDVYYPVPFKSNPYLVVEFDRYTQDNKIVSQHPDKFIVYTTSGITVKWKATGRLSKDD